MEPINVVIGRTSGGMFWEGIRHLLKSVEGLRVTICTPTDSLEVILERERPQVLLLEVAQGAPSAEFLEFFDRWPNLAIIALDPTGAEQVMRLRDLGRDLLVRLIKEVARERTEAGPPNPGPRIRMLNAWEANKLAGACVEPAPHIALEYTNDADYLADICQWLDLILRERLACGTFDADEVGTPGWTMGVGRAYALLGGGDRQDAVGIEPERQQLESQIHLREHASRLAGTLPRMVALADAFGLDPIERKALHLALAPEIDGRFARVFGFLNDDLTRRRPTPSLLAQLLFGGDALAWKVQQLIAGNGPIARYRLLASDTAELSAMPRSEVGLTLAGELLAYLLAQEDQQPAYMPAIRLLYPAAVWRPEDNPDTEELRDLLERMTRGSLPTAQLVGGDGARRWFERVAIGAGHAVAVLDLARVEEMGMTYVADTALAATRVARLHDAILLVTGFERVAGAAACERLTAAIAGVVRQLVPLAVLQGEMPWLASAAEAGHRIWLIEPSAPSWPARAALWRGRAESLGFGLAEADARALANAVRFEEPQIDATLRLCGDADQGTLPLKTVQAAARRVARTTKPSMVRTLEMAYGWDDIVLPPAVLAHLKEIPSHVRHSGEVLEDWGYRARLPYGQGVAALFSGPSGTGKTMAAQIVARELGVELFQVDLAKTISKYIGETEKNLDQVFEAAECASAVLLFDEADALFGKRTEVKDAHDRYANVEVAYLLQRMEAYAGLAILTTNLKRNIDHGFLRRLRFVVDFPAPDSANREAIWRRAFPPAAPLSDEVDITFLARRLALTGGHIQQIAVKAAFAAAAAASPITMQHVVQATRQELVKLGMLNAEKSVADLAA